MNINKTIIAGLFIILCVLPFSQAYGQKKYTSLNIETDGDPKTAAIVYQTIIKVLLEKGFLTKKDIKSAVDKSSKKTHVSIGGKKKLTIKKNGAKEAIVGTITKLDDDSYDITLRVVTVETGKISRSKSVGNVQKKDIEQATRKLLEALLEKLRQERSSVAVLFLTSPENLNYWKFGAELRLFLDTPYFGIPIEVLFLSGDFRIRTWPYIYLSPRAQFYDYSFIISLYSEGNVKKTDNDYSFARLGLGAGFICQDFMLGFWLTASFSHGSPTITEILGYRLRTKFYPIDKLSILLAFDLGNVSSKSINYSTFTTSFALELEVACNFYDTLSLIVGYEGYSNNIGHLLNLESKVNGIDSDFKSIFKIGINYDF